MPRMHGLVVVVGAERARRARRAERSIRTIDILRHDDALPWHDVLLRLSHDQRACQVGQLWMRSKEGFDLAGTGCAQAWNASPPAAPARNAHCDFRQGLDAAHMPGLGHPCRQPASEVVADQRLGHDKRRQQLN